jgi:hypothetical protein
MHPRLFAFDLDGTLLASDKSLSPANRRALAEMDRAGAMVALASGRMGASVLRAARDLPLDPALLSLNGAAVYKRKSDGGGLVFSMPLPAEYANHLIDHGRDREFAINYYIDDGLYTVRTPTTGRWNDLYHQQTKSEFRQVDSLDRFRGRRPFKVLYCGDPAVLDKEESRFRALWGAKIYIVRTWEYYLEFMHADANKGAGLAALARACGIDPLDTVAFGDADNDIPMLASAGLGIAMANAGQSVKAAAHRVSAWTNDEDGVAREWEIIRREYF